MNMYCNAWLAHVVVIQCDFGLLVLMVWTHWFLCRSQPATQVPSLALHGETSSEWASPAADLAGAQHAATLHVTPLSGRRPAASATANHHNLSGASKSSDSGSSSSDVAEPGQAMEPQAPGQQPPQARSQPASGPSSAPQPDGGAPSQQQPLSVPTHAQPSSEPSQSQPQLLPHDSQLDAGDGGSSGKGLWKSWWPKRLMPWSSDKDKRHDKGQGSGPGQKLGQDGGEQQHGLEGSADAVAAAHGAAGKACGIENGMAGRSVDEVVELTGEVRCLSVACSSL